jgi:fructosamine-3-kinase
MNSELRRDLTAEDGPLAGAVITDVSPVGGGCIHQAWKLRLRDGQVLFAKSGGARALPLFEVEAEALEALHAQADTSFLVVPQPISLAALPHGAVLLLPWLDCGGSDQTALGRGLALLHQASMASSPGRFGWHRDGFIGAGAQPGGWRDDWGLAFVELRLRPQLEALDGLKQDSTDLNPLLLRLAEDLNEHQPRPALVHGDLWGGNAACLSDGRGSIFDPASWWADREVDLAMTRLFGGFGEDFRSGYREVLPDAPGADGRVEIYNLYHLLNHANLFGGSYLSQCRASLRDLARRL